MTINHILTIALLLFGLAIAGYIDGGTQKHIASYCDSQEPETHAEQANFNAYCGK